MEQLCEYVNCYFRPRSDHLSDVTSQCAARPATETSSKPGSPSMKNQKTACKLAAKNRSSGRKTSPLLTMTNEIEKRATRSAIRYSGRRLLHPAKRKKLRSAYQARPAHCVAHRNRNCRLPCNTIYRKRYTDWLSGSIVWRFHNAPLSPRPSMPLA